MRKLCNYALKINEFNEPWEIILRIAFVIIIYIYILEDFLISLTSGFFIICIFLYDDQSFSLLFLIFITYVLSQFFLYY